MDDFDYSLTESKKEEVTKSPPIPMLIKPETGKPQAAKIVALFPQKQHPIVIPEPEEATKEVATKKKRGRPQKPKAEVAPPQEPAWEPTGDDLKQIYELAELGWPCAQISDVLSLTAKQFAAAIQANSKIKEVYEAGVEACKGFADRKLAWRPLPGDIGTVRCYAAKGLREVEIAAKLEISRTAFSARLADTPQLKDAYEQGEGEYRAQIMAQGSSLLANEDESLKYVGGFLTFNLKSRCGLSDKPEPVREVQINGKIEHTMSLKAPPKVPSTDIAAFAAAEMARATQISEKSLAHLPKDDVVDVEVTK